MRGTTERRVGPPARVRGRARVRVFLADDQPIVRTGVIAAIRSRTDLLLVGATDDGREALERIRDLRPDVALLDSSLSGVATLELIATIAAEHLPTRALLFADVCDGAEIHDAMLAGASGCLTKDEAVTDICHAIRVVAGGKLCLSSRAQVALLDHVSSFERPAGPPAAGPAPLTPREVEIVRLMAAGVSSAQIGRQLHLSESTVKNHRRHIYSKLGAVNSAAAIYLAVRAGLVS